MKQYGKYSIAGKATDDNMAYDLRLHTHTQNTYYLLLSSAKVVARKLYVHCLCVCVCVFFFNFGL
jgi:hypothetical protein